MKNVFLLFLLSGLLTIAYFLDRDEEKIESALFANGSITKLVLPNITIDFANTSELEKSKLEKLLKRVYALRIVKTYTNIELKNRKKISFKVSQKEKESQVFFHDFNPITGAFYLSLNTSNDIHLIEDTYTFNGFYKNEQELFKKRYESLVNLLNSDLNYFKRKRVFNGLEIKKLISKSSTNRAFIIDFNANSISPLPPKGVEHVNLSLVRDQLQDMSYLETKESLARSKLVSTLLINDLETVKIFKQDDKYYIHRRAKFFEVKRDDLNYLIGSMQNLWIKKVNIDFVKRINESKMIFTIEYQDKTFNEFTLKDLNVFSYKENQGREFNKNYLNLLFNVIFNATPFEEAKFILSDVRQKCTGIKLSISKRQFCFIQNGKDLRLIDINSKLEYFYQDVIDQSIQLTKNNFLISDS